MDYDCLEECTSLADLNSQGMVPSRARRTFSPPITDRLVFPFLPFARGNAVHRDSTRSPTNDNERFDSHEIATSANERSKSIWGAHSTKTDSPQAPCRPFLPLPISFSVSLLPPPPSSPASPVNRPHARLLHFLPHPWFMCSPSL